MIGKSYLQIEKNRNLRAELQSMAMTYFYRDDLNRAVVGVGSSDKTVGLSFWSLWNSFSVYNKNTSGANTDFSAFTIVANGGSAASGYNLQEMLQEEIPSSSSSSPEPTSSSSSSPTPTSSSSASPEPTSSSSGSETGSQSETSSGSEPGPAEKGNSVWVFLGILLILIILSVAWFAYAQSKGDDYDDDEGIYKSIDPTSKLEGGNEFETGLDPDEDGEDALN